MTRDELEGQLSDMANEKAMWKSLMEHPAWEEYSRLAQENVTARQVNINSPLPAFSAVLASEFIKGEMAGISLMKHLPALLLEQAEANHTRLKIELENFNADQEQARAAAASSRVDNDNFAG